MVEIKTRCCGAVICSGDTATNAAIQGYVDRVSFRGAALVGVDWAEMPTAWALEILSEANEPLTGGV